MTTMHDTSKTAKIIATVVIALLLLGGGFLIGTITSDTSPERPGSDTSAQAEDAAPDNASASTPKSGLAAYDENGDGMVYQGPMHPEVVQDEPGTCPVCGMDLTLVQVDGGEEEGIRISPATLQNIGVRTAEVPVEPLRRTIRTTGRFEMDEQGMRSVSLKVGGWVEKLYADFEGAIVEKGQPLLELYSPELVSTQEEYLLALRNARRTGDTPDARRLLDAARRRLAYWDLTEAQIDRLEEAGAPRRTITFYAPSSGEVMHKNVTAGQRIEPGQTLMQIADITKVWLIADVYEQDLPWIDVGTPVRVKLVADPGQTYTGRVDHIYHMMDAGARTARARIELPGGHHTLLKPGAYATVYLEGRESEPAPVVPEEAVVSSGEEDFVVRALGGGRFQPVPVQTGLQASGRVQILRGLEGGEEVVTSAQFLIDSEARLQSSIGAMAGHAGHGGEGESRTQQPSESMGAEDEHEQMELPSVDGGDAEVHDAHGASVQHHGDVSAQERPAHAPQDSVQVVQVTVGPDGFEPQQIELEADAPARLVFTRTTDATCATEVQVPDFDIEKTELPLGEPVAIEFTPNEAGPFTFACGMGMLEGTLVIGGKGE